MERTEKYTPEVWQKISRLPYMIAIGMEGAGNSGFAGSANERHSALLSILSGRTDFPGNPLISSILPAKETDDEAISLILEEHDAALDFLSELDIKTAAELQDMVLDCIGQVLPAIQGREAGHTLSDYSAWLLKIAETVAQSAKEGDFLGFGGEKFSSLEHKFYNALTQSLEV
jgi:hypothetical protein